MKHLCVTVRQQELTWVMGRWVTWESNVWLQVSHVWKGRSSVMWPTVKVHVINKKVKRKEKSYVVTCRDMTHEYSHYLAHETYMRHTATSGDNESLVDRQHKTTINHKHKHNAHIVTFCFGPVSSRVPIDMSFALTCRRLACQRLVVMLLYDYSFLGLL